MNKKRLGRGLGSLLSTGAEDFGEPAVETKENKKEDVAKKALLKTRPSQEKKIEPQPVKEKEIKYKEIPEGQRVWSLAIEKVKPNPTQPRKDFVKEALEELAQSIKEQGVLQPITVRKNQSGYEIIAGERRWRASQLAGLQEVPAIIKEVDDQKSMELALIENLQRENLNSVEEAMGYQVLIDDYDLSQQEVASKVGKSRSSVTNSLRLLTLPRDIKQMLRQNLISLGHGKVLLGVADPKAQVSLARKTIKKKLSVRALEQEVAKLGRTTGIDDQELSVNDRLVQTMSLELQRKLGTKVKINYKNGKGKIEISFYSDDELNGLNDKIKGQP